MSERRGGDVGSRTGDVGLSMRKHDYVPGMCGANPTLMRATAWLVSTAHGLYARPAVAISFRLHGFANNPLDNAN